MRIMIDGCDGTGKSTVIDKLSEIYRCNVIKLTKYGPSRQSVYLDFLPLDDVIHDRSFVSELIYCKIFKRTDWLSEEFAKSLVDCYDEFNVHRFILTASSDVIKTRIVSRGREFDAILKNIDCINDRYVEYATKFGFKLIDTSHKSIGEIVAEIGGSIHETI